MSLNKRIRAYLITFILIISSLSFLAITPVNVKAEENAGGTQPLYFTAYNLTEGMEGYPEMSLTLPEAKNDSLFPPSITNTEEWLMWFETWIMSKAFSPDMILEELGMNESELEENASELGMTVEEFLEYLGFSDTFNPFVMQETYTYTGEDELYVNGTITFDLYFSSNLPSRLLYKDQVEVTISVIDTETFEEVYSKNTTATIESKLFGGKIQKQTISIDGVDFTLKNEDQIVFSIEMLPSEKLIGNLIGSQDEERLLEIADMMADVLINQNLSSNLKQIGETIKEFINTSQSEGGYNLTLEDLAELANAIRSSSFIFNSAEHASSVTLPITLPGEENTITYYLSTDSSGDKILTEEVPTSQNVSRANLKSPQNWTGPSLSRNKILTGVTASLYIQNRDLIRLLNLGKTKVNLILSFGEHEFNASVELKKTTIFSILKPVKPTEIKFTFDPEEIPYGTDMSLQISSDVKGLGFRKMARLLYDSSKYQSSITLQFNETDNIKMSVDSADQKIVAGGSAKYILKITSKYDDKVDITINENDKQGDWNVDYPDSVEVSPDGDTLVHVFANYMGTTYDNYIQMTIEAVGKTGIARQEVSATVSMDAVEYDVIVTAPSGREIKHGTSGTYTFTIKNNNTGLISDTYDIEAISEHDWTVEIDYEYTEVQAGHEFNVDVTVFVPEFTEINSDILTLIITSKSGKETVAEVTTTVILPNILEHIYNFFESSAESLGLDTILGDYAGAFLIFIIIFIIIIFLVIIIHLLRIKYVEIICLDRIKEIEPEEKAEFDINIRNPYKRKLTYKISVEMDPKSEGWEASVDTEDMVLESKESHLVKLTVKPNDYVKTDGWVEIKVAAENVEKRKIARISTVTSIKHAEPELKISGVFHWPTVFKKGDKVITSFRVHNDGKASASNVSITLFVNGEEKNKAENITIPRGGYAEIEMPWIAVKGKNEVNIVVK